MTQAPEGMGNIAWFVGGQLAITDLFDIMICLIYIKLDFVKNLSERRVEDCTGSHIKGRWRKIRCVTLE
jgi:hypothetical protein